MIGLDLSSYVATLFLTGIALLGLQREWTSYRKPTRWTLSLLIAFAGIAGCFTTYFSGVQARASSSQIAGLTGALKTQQELFRADFARLSNEVVDLKTKVRTQELQDQLKRTEEELRATQKALEPGPKARVIATFFTNDEKEVPVREAFVSLVADSVTIEFRLHNSTGQAALGGTFWIRICNGCKYAEEPGGFAKAKGAIENERILHFRLLLPHTFSHKMTAKIIPPAPARKFQIGFRVLCENCEVQEWQNMIVSVLR